MTAAATAETTSDPTAGLFDDPEEATTPPDFKKMKKPALVEFYSKAFDDGSLEAALTPDKNGDVYAPFSMEEFAKLKVPEIRETLKGLFADPEALDSPAVTGFDPKDVIHATVAEIAAIENETQAIAMIVLAQDASEFNFFKIGGVLAEMQTRDWCGEYDKFYDFVLAIFGYKTRKAQTLIQIYHKLVGCGATWEEAKEVGWGKLAVIAAHLEPDNYKEWFEKAKDATHAELTAGVRDSNENGETPDPAAASNPVKKMTFALHEDQQETVDDALAKAKQDGNTDYDAPALEYICADFLAGDGPVASELRAAQPQPQPQPSPEDEVVEAGDEIDIKALFQDLVEAAEEVTPLAEEILTAFDEVFSDIHVTVYLDGKPELQELVESLLEDHSLDDVQNVLDSAAIES